MARIYQRWLALVSGTVRADLVLPDPTIDLDASDVEVYGRTKCGVGWSSAGVRSGRVHLASWAQAELRLAAELTACNDDVRPRADAPDPGSRGYFDAAPATTAVGLGCDVAIAAKRNPAAWRALAAVPDDDWQDARGMAGAQVAACDYPPAGWPVGTYPLIRRVQVPTEQLSADPRVPPPPHRRPQPARVGPRRRRRGRLGGQLHPHQHPRQPR